jgi:hypothetical protein
MTGEQAALERADAYEQRCAEAERMLAEADALLGIVLESPAGRYLEYTDEMEGLCRGVASGIATFRGRYKAWTS